MWRQTVPAHGAFNGPTQQAGERFWRPQARFQRFVFAAQPAVREFDHPDTRPDSVVVGIRIDRLVAAQPNFVLRSVSEKVLVFVRTVDLGSASDTFVSIPHMGCMPYGHVIRSLILEKETSFNPSYGLHALRAQFALSQRRCRLAVSIPHMGCMPYGL